MRANFADIYLRGMRDRSMRSGTELAREIQLTDWSTAGNLSNRSSGVQIPRDICTRFGRYLYSTRCSWIIKHNTIEYQVYCPDTLSLIDLVEVIFFLQNVYTVFVLISAQPSQCLSDKP